MKRAIVCAAALRIWSTHLKVLPSDNRAYCRKRHRQHNRFEHRGATQGIRASGVSYGVGPGVDCSEVISFFICAWSAAIF